MSDYSLTSGNVLHGEALSRTADAARYSFSDCGMSGERPIPSLPLVKSAEPLESWWDLAPTYAGAADDWKQVLGPSEAKVPLYLRHPDRNYSFEVGAAGDPFYIQYNRAADAADEPIVAFAKRARDAIAAAKPLAIVVDLRFNTGGNDDLTPPLVEAVKRAPRSSRVYVITGRATFSAGIAAAAQLREAREMTIVGEPVGDALEFWSEGGNIVLPWSGLYVHFANGAHSLSPKPCPTMDYCENLSVRTLAPDFSVPLSWADYRAGRDPAMAAIRNELRRVRR